MRKALLFGSALTLAAVGGVWLSPPAHADKTKTCVNTSVTEPVTNPPNGNAGFTQTTTTTETQTAACNSSSDTGENLIIVVSPTTNKGGGTPGGH